jgi:hypothetical protein
VHPTIIDVLEYFYKFKNYGRVKCAGTVTTPRVNRFPAGTLRYQETELIYIFLKSFGGW